MQNQIITASNFEKARQAIKSAKHPIIFSSNDDELNRQVLEKEKIDILLLNQKERKDFQKQRNSGFNQVLAKLCKKNNITLGINLNEIIESTKVEKAKILARVKQNIKLCNKNKVKMIFLGKKRDNYDLKSLGYILGMPTSITKTF